jgi:hypothetical protein
MSSVPFTFAGNTGNIPLSQLDVNFANVKLSVDYVIQNVQANITSLGTLTGLSASGNVLVSGLVSVSGNSIVTGNSSVIGNLSVDGTINATGNTIHGNVLTSGLISAAGNITGGNLRTSGSISATGNITGGNLLTSGSISATGNVIANVAISSSVSTSSLAAGDASLSGNLIVAGNATVNGTTTFINTTNLNITDKNITIANGVSTSALIDGAGIDAGNPTVAYIRYSNANQGWTTANSFTIGTTLSVTGNATLGGNTALSGVSTAPTPGNTTANTQIATTAFVRNILPTGVIVMWSGAIVNIPDGWFLCDGGNSTPDLRDRFIVGAGSTYAVAATGGSANATLVSHNHTATSTVTDPGHVHPPLAPATSFGGGPNSGQGLRGDAPQSTSTATTGSATTGITVSTSISTEGSSATNANLPPYYALAYIMKA